MTARVMKHFTKALCVVDTCSIINLDDITLGRQDILYHMRCDFDVHVSGVIVDEFLRHKDKVSSEESSFWNRFLRSKKHEPEALCDDSKALGVFHSIPPRFGGMQNAGEYGNARVAMELLMTCQAGHVVFVTDDAKAWRAFLERLRESFPGIALWTSLDVVMYVAGVLMKKGHIGHDDVRAAFRDVIAAAAKWPNMNEQEKSNLIRRRAAAEASLSRLATVAKLWRE